RSPDLLAEHLADDDLDVLVGDLDAIETVNLLYFRNEMLLQLLRSEHIEDVVRRHCAFGELLAFDHEIVLGNDNVLVERDEVFFGIAGLWIGDDDLALAAHGAADFD